MPTVMHDHTAARRTLGALCCLWLTTSACATAGQMDAAEARISALERERDQLRDKMSEDMGKLERLHAMLVSAEETLRKSGADLGLRVERLEQAQTRQGGDLETLVFKLRQAESNLEVIKRELADRLGSTAVYLPADVPRDADPLWELAEARAKARELLEAKALYELFAASFAKDPRAPLAHYRTGEAFEAAGDLENAIKSYQLVYDRFPDAPEAPRAVTRIADIFVKKGDCGRAKNLLRFVETSFKGTPEAAAAKARGKNVMKECPR
jgi:TolA-binding protein